MTFTGKGETLRGDFWGWGQFAPTDGRVIVNRDLRFVRSNATGAEIGVSNDWMIGDKVALQEATAIRVSEEPVHRGAEAQSQRLPCWDREACQACQPCSSEARWCRPSTCPQSSVES
jgi:hypothetical protein